MAKGDGWAVKRYVCPSCKRKGLYYWGSLDVSYRSFRCMYKNCNTSTGNRMYSLQEAAEVNPILKTEPPQYKPDGK